MITCYGTQKDYVNCLTCFSNSQYYCSDNNSCSDDPSECHCTDGGYRSNGDCDCLQYTTEKDCKVDGNDKVPYCVWCPKAGLCLHSSDGVIPRCYSSCQYGATLPLWGLIVICVGGGLVVLAAILMLYCFVVRRRVRTYEPIN